MNSHTYVLVHGAFHGGWCWKDVATRLRALGHTVYTPTLTGLGERAHLLKYGPTLDTFIEDVAQVIRYEDLQDVILVGHSFAGSVVSALADQMKERLRHLFYLDALVLPPGQSSADRSPELVAAYRTRAIEVGHILAIPPASPEQFGITDPQQAAWVKTKITPHPLQTYHDRLNLSHPLGNGLPATYVACTQPFMASTKESRERAQSISDWKYLEIPTGHDAMLSMPVELTRLLDQAGRDLV